jgi:hypothetical protein
MCKVLTAIYFWRPIICPCYGFSFEQYWIAYRSERPWLSVSDDSEQYRLRYELDEGFHQRELNRAAKRRLWRGLDWRMQWYIRRAFKGLDRPHRVECLLGYSLDALRHHLEGLMTDGMTWQQYLDADVVIDHKRPIHTFDMKDHAQFLQCWALDNLQPLTKRDNAAKLSQDIRWSDAA